MNSVFRAIGLFSCALVVVILCAQPQLLQEVSPGWQQSWGLILFGVAVLGTVVYGFRVLKVLVGFVVWSGMAAVIGLAVFENQLPATYVHDGFDGAGAAVLKQINVEGLSAQAGQIVSVVLSKTMGKAGQEISGQLPSSQAGAGTELVAHAQEALVLGRISIPQ